MRLIASGRDCDVFDLGDGTVLRRQRGGRPLEGEAVIMRYVREHGYPCPVVHRTAGADLVMDKVEGPTMLADLFADLTTERAETAAEMLADLHRRLHAIPPPGGDGPSVIHLDLHPDNVILSPDGPVVIDWPNATVGEPSVDVATTWLIVEPYRSLAPEVDAFLDAFLDAVGREAARAGLPVAGPRRLADPNVTADERPAIRRLLELEGVAER